VPFAILLLGVYLIYRAFGESLNLDEGAKTTGCSVLAIGALLAGITAALRIPRLTRDFFWRLGALLCFVAGVAAFLGLLALGQTLEDRLTAAIGLALRDTFGLHLPPTILSVPSPILMLLGAVAAGTMLAYILSRLAPSWGVKPMILVAGALLVLLITVRLGWLGHYEEYQQIKHVLAGTGITGDELEQKASATFRLFAESGGPSGPGNAQAFARAVLRKVKQEQQEGAKAKDVVPAAQGPQAKLLARVAEGMPQLSDEEEAPPPRRGSVWPVFVAGALFLYLWWLAAMCFDLLVAWNYYIRESGVIAALQERARPAEMQAEPRRKQYADGDPHEPIR
jgi:hypothetical protein